MIRLIAVSLLLALPVAVFSQRSADEASAVQAVLDAGGTVIRDEKHADKPVIRVELTACQIEPAAFETLRFLTRLRHLDL